MTEERKAYEIRMKPVAVSPGLVPKDALLVTLDKARAEAIVAQLPTHRSMREIPWSEIPEKDRLRLEQAEAARS